MIIDMAEASVEGRIFEGEDPSSILEMEGVGSGRAEAVSPVRYRLTAHVLSDELVVRGALHVDISFVCSRCMAPFVVRVGEPSFERVYELGDRMECVDLTLDMREAIILAFPSYPVCRINCNGLCSQCGANLNEGRCHCRPSADVRWNALNGLNIK